MTTSTSSGSAGGSSMRSEPGRKARLSGNPSSLIMRTRFAGRHQREAEGELRADRVAVRPDVADEDKRLVAAKNIAELLEAGVLEG